MEVYHRNACSSYQQSFPSPNSIRNALVLTEDSQKFILDSRKIISNILFGNDPRLLVIIGPCSIHNLEEALEYAVRLKQLSLELSDVAYVVMRAYLEKPRTAYGWKGWVNDPNLDESGDIRSGIFSGRKFLLQLAEQQIPLAYELLNPFLAPYFTDLISWGCIGARTVTSPIHRQLASAYDFPIGFKNGLDGDIEVALMGILSAQKEHHFLSIAEDGYLTQIHSAGNLNTHLILRGGNKGANYSESHIKQACESLAALHLKQSIVVDCAHGNSITKPDGQLNVWESILEQRQKGDCAIKGALLESYIHKGKQSITAPRNYGVSVTDPCLSWEDTAEMLLRLKKG